MLADTHPEAGEQGQQRSEGDDVQAAELDQDHQHHMALVGEERLGILDHQARHAGGARRGEQGVEKVHAAAFRSHFRQHQQSGSAEDEEEEAADKEGRRVESEAGEGARPLGKFHDHDDEEVGLHQPDGPVLHGFNAQGVQCPPEEHLAGQHIADALDDQQAHQPGFKRTASQELEGVEVEEPADHEMQDIESEAGLDDADEPVRRIGFQWKPVIGHETPKRGQGHDDVDRLQGREDPVPVRCRKTLMRSRNSKASCVEGQVFDFPHEIGGVDRHHTGLLTDQSTGEVGSGGEIGGGHALGEQHRGHGDDGVSCPDTSRISRGWAG